MAACDRQELVIREIPSCPGYGASNDGRIWSRKSQMLKAEVVDGWKLMRTPPSNLGYPQVRIKIGGIRKTYKVSRLVLEAFVGPPPGGMQARHVFDNNPANNAIWNLAWGTPKQNCHDRKIHGTNPQGERNAHSKLTLVQVRQAYGMFQSGMLIREIADHFGIDRSQMGKILKGKYYRDVADKITPPLEGQLAWSRGATIREARKRAEAKCE